jgi:DNA-binding CsgD family transcriptional regulator
MLPISKLTFDTVFQVTERAWLTKARPNVSRQYITVCLRLDDGSFAGFCFLELDDKGIYHDGDTEIGMLDEPRFTEYIRKISKDPAEEEQELFAGVCGAYAESKSIKKTAKQLSISEERTRRILITEGAYTCEQHEKIMELLEQGKSIEEISALINMSVKQIKTYLPYKKEFE